MEQTYQDFQTIKALAAICSDTLANWTAKNPVLPVGVLTYETDTGKVKVGNGTDHFVDTPYLIEESLTPEAAALLANAGKANGVAVLDAAGKIALDNLPDVIRGSVVYVDDIAARDALPPEKKSGLVVVIDASADPTVQSTSGGKVLAMYAFAVPSGADEGADKEWIKISEQEGLDISLENYFNKDTQTLDDINDGTTYVRMTAIERTKLEGIEEGADVTTTEKVRAAGAIMNDDKLFLVGLNATELAALVGVTPEQ